MYLENDRLFQKIILTCYRSRCPMRMTLHHSFLASLCPCGICVYYSSSLRYGSGLSYAHICTKHVTNIFLSFSLLTYSIYALFEYIIVYMALNTRIQKTLAKDVLSQAHMHRASTLESIKLFQFISTLKGCVPRKKLRPSSIIAEKLSLCKIHLSHTAP